MMSDAELVRAWLVKVRGLHWVQNSNGHWGYASHGPHDTRPLITDLSQWDGRWVAPDEPELDEEFAAAVLDKMAADGWDYCIQGNGQGVRVWFRRQNMVGDAIDKDRKRAVVLAARKARGVEVDDAKR